MAVLRFSANTIIKQSSKSQQSETVEERERERDIHSLAPQFHAVIRSVITCFITSSDVTARFQMQGKEKLSDGSSGVLGFRKKQLP